MSHNVINYKDVVRKDMDKEREQNQIDVTFLF